MGTHNIHKFAVIFLVAVFLVINVADAFGYVWCLGDDGHVDLQQVDYDGCCAPTQLNSERETKYKYADGPSFSKAEACGPCIDLFVKQGSATLSKRYKRTSPVSFELATGDSFLTVNRPGKVTPTVSGWPQNRVSQAIRCHRTIVLLN